MQHPFAYNKQLDNLINGYEHVLAAVNENTENILLDNLNEEQNNLVMQLLVDTNAKPVFTQMRALHEVAMLMPKKWAQNRELKIFFMNGNKDINMLVLNVASEWSDHCNITFVETKNVAQSDIRVSFTATGFWSYIGTDALLVAKDKATVNFQLANVDTASAYFHGVILHEFGHVLGLIHEHQSPAVEMQWKKEYIYNVFFYGLDWDRPMVDANLFDTFDTTSVKYSELDIHSIMAYNIPSIFTYNNFVFPQNNVLSDIDKDYIGSLYPKGFGALHS